MTPGDLRPEKVPQKWEPPSPASPEVGAGLTEGEGVIGHQDFRGRVSKPDWQVSSWSTEARLPAGTLALPSFPALASPLLSPGRA